MSSSPSELLLRGEHFYFNRNYRGRRTERDRRKRWGKRREREGGG